MRRALGDGEENPLKLNEPAGVYIDRSTREELAREAYKLLSESQDGAFVVPVACMSGRYIVYGIKHGDSIEIYDCNRALLRALATTQKIDAEQDERAEEMEFAPV